MRFYTTSLYYIGTARLEWLRVCIADCHISILYNDLFFNYRYRYMPISRFNKDLSSVVDDTVRYIVIFFVYI